MLVLGYIKDLLAAIKAQFPAAVGPATPAGSLSTVAAKAGIGATNQVSITGGNPAVALTTTATYPNGIMVRNLDAANTVYLGKDASVNASTGFPVKAGETWSATGQWDPSTVFVFAASTTSIAYMGLS